MDSTFWMALSAVAAVLALAGAGAVHVVRYAYQRGVADSRIAELEKKVAKQEESSSAIAGLTAAVAALGTAFERAEKAMHDRMAQVEQALMRRAAARPANPGN